MNPTDTPASNPGDDDNRTGKTDQDQTKPTEVKEAPKTNPADDHADDVTPQL